MRDPNPEPDLPTVVQIIITPHYQDTGRATDFILVNDEGPFSDKVLEGPGTFTLEIEVGAGENEYTLRVEDCGSTPGGGPAQSKGGTTTPSPSPAPKVPTPKNKTFPPAPKMLVYNPGFQLAVAAVFGILLLRKPLQALVKQTVLRPFEKPPELISNLLAVSLAAQIATASIIATSFEEVSVVGVLTNLVAVPLSGPILTLGLLRTLAGNVAAPLAYLVNASNGFLVTGLVNVAEAASALPFAAVGTPGATLPLVGLFYLGCVPTAIAESAFPEERWP